MGERPAQGTVVLTRGEVRELLDLGECIGAVERAFRAHGRGEAPAPAILGVHVADGGFHVKAGVLEEGGPFFVAKTNANFPTNPQRHRLPTIQGTIVLHDATNGVPLAVMDSIEISIQRTGAATAVAARHLARPNAATVAVAGCGEQGRVQLRAVSRVLPLECAVVWDLDPQRAEALAGELEGELGLAIVVASDFRAAARQSDVIITCTPSTEYLLGPDDVGRGAFVAGVGADNPEKRELEPALLAAGRVVVDVLDQAAAIGDLHHAIEAGVLTREAVHAELGEIVAGIAPGRTDAEEITIFDSTGMALQDVAAAMLVYRGAIETGAGCRIDFGS